MTDRKSREPSRPESEESPRSRRGKTRRAAAKRGPRGDITEEALLAAADSVLVAAGHAGLSLRSVAGAAGVAPTAIYTYFDDMAALRNRLGDAFLARLDLGLLAGPPGRTADLHATLIGFVEHVISVFDASPEHVRLLASTRVFGPASLALNEALLEFFVDRAGQEPRRAHASVGMLTEWLHGRAFLALSDETAAATARELSRLDLDAYPLTASMLRGDSASAVDPEVRLIVRAALAED